VLGATTCLECPANSHASQAGAPICDACGCNDGIACTRDDCDPVTGACSAPPIAECEVVTFAFEGVVTGVHPELAACFELGAPFAGAFDIDPEAPDEAPTNSGTGLYQSLSAFELRVGAGPGALSFSGVAPEGVSVTNGSGLGDMVAFSSSVDGPVACGTPRGASVVFTDFGGPTLSSDAQVADATTLLDFPTSYALLQFEGPETEPPILLEADVVTLIPEPGAALHAGGVAAALAALRVSLARATASQRRRA
jgi:hypothetical protein